MSKKIVRMHRTPSGRLKKMPELMRQKQEAARERHIQALELRKAGATYAEIADALGYKTPQGAKVAVDTQMKRTVFDLAEDIVVLDLQRLDEFQKRCMAQLRTKNDLSQIDRIMRIMDKRYQLAGVAPETVKKIQDAYGLEGANINNNGVMVVQVGHKDENEFVRSLMRAAGVDTESKEARAYLERVDTKEITTGPAESSTPTPPSRTVKGAKGKKIRIVKKRVPVDPLEELLSAEKRKPQKGSHIGGSNKGVSIGGPNTHPLQDSVHTQLDEEEIIDAEIVE